MEQYKPSFKEKQVLDNRYENILKTPSEFSDFKDCDARHKSITFKANASPQIESIWNFTKSMQKSN